MNVKNNAEQKLIETINTGSKLSKEAQEVVKATEAFLQAEEQEEPNHYCMHTLKHLLNPGGTYIEKDDYLHLIDSLRKLLFIPEVGKQFKEIINESSNHVYESLERLEKFFTDLGEEKRDAELTRFSILRYHWQYNDKESLRVDKEHFTKLLKKKELENQLDNDRR